MADFDWANAAKPAEEEGFDWSKAAEPAGVPVATEGRPTATEAKPEKDFGDVVTEKARAALQGATFGYADELAGLIASKFPSLDRPVGDLFGEAKPARSYTEARDQYRHDQEKAADENPLTALAGAFVTPGMGSMKGAAGLAKFAAAGGLSSLGSSHADLTKGRYADAAVDTGIGMGTGLAFGGAAKGLVKGLGAVGRGIANLAPKAEALAENQATAATDKAIAGKLGQYRSGVQSASRDLEVLTRARDELPDGPLRQEIADYLQSKDATGLLEQVAKGKLGTAPERVSDMAGLLGEYQAAAGSRAADIATQKGELLSSPFKKGILPRLKTDLSRNVPIAIGSMVGGVPGMVAGAAVGAAFGSRGTAWSNALKSPRLQKAAGDLFMRPGLAVPARTARALAKAAAESPTAFVAMHQFFKESDPTYPAKDVEDELARRTSDAP